MKKVKQHIFWTQGTIFCLSGRKYKRQGLQLTTILCFFLLINTTGFAFKSDTTIIVPKPTINANNPVCEDGTLKLETPFQNNTIFHWYAPNGEEISVVATATIPNIDLSMAGKYSLKAEQDGCFSEVEFIDIQVLSKPEAPVITNNGPLCEGETLLLDGPTLANTEYKWIDPFGTVISNEEDVTIENIPKELAGNYFLEITQSGCTSHLGGTDVGVIAINEIPKLNIATAVCEGDSLKIKGPHVAGANYLWQGPNNFQSDAADSLVFPIANTNLNGTFTLMLEAAGCVSPVGSIVVEVAEKPTARLTGGGIFCEGDKTEIGIHLTGTSPFDLVYSINQVVQPEFTSPKASFSIPVAPTQQERYALVSLKDQTGCSAEIDFEEKTVTVFPKPTTSLITDTLCTESNEYYQAVFIVKGGVKPYVSAGLSGTLSDSIFTSDLIESGAAYNFQIIDNNNCASAEISGRHACLCNTDAGTVDLTPIILCGSETATIIHEGNESLDVNDQLLFVLHDSPIHELGEILATSTEPNFSYTNNLVFGQTYYVSPVAGNKDGLIIDFEDRCFSVGQGTPLTFQEVPKLLSISGQQSICPGATLTLQASEAEGATYVWQTPIEIIETSNPKLVIPNISSDYSGDFRVSIRRGECVSLPSSNFTVEVTIPSGQADAGLDTISCGNASIFLDAKIPDFGFGKWTVNSGAYVLDPFDAKSKVVTLQEGLNVFYWTLSTDECPNFETDSVIIAYRPNATARNDSFELDKKESIIDLNVLSNDITPGGHDFWVELFGLPHVGVVEDLGDGDFSYKRPFDTFEGATVFTYLLCFDTPTCSVLCDTGAVIIDVMLDPFDPNVYVPDGITPNNDGTNDQLVIEGIENHPENELILFDRWGNLIFQASPYKNSWDGTLNNAPLPEGAYYYVLKTDITNKRTLKGRVYIIR